MISYLSRSVKLPGFKKTFQTGWLPPMLDPRDYTVNHEKVKKLSDRITPKTMGIPPSVDLRPWCSPVEDQETLGSCTAHAAAGIVEYLQRRALGRHLDASRLFIYKTTRKLLGWSGDTGAWCRSTMAALRLFGAPPEVYWPYTDNRHPGPGGDQRTFDDEPPAFVYAIGENYEALTYFVHDPIGLPVDTAELLARIKLYLAAGIPSMFGFYGFRSFGYGDEPGHIPFPHADETPIWGHAIDAVGYDDNRVIKNTLYDTTTTGALLIRNSWGTGWGDDGYGWLPYEYVLQRYALDFWSLFNMEWVDLDKFNIPASSS